MEQHAVMCPQCGAPLAPHRFARSIVCSHCGATVRLDESSVSASRFHEAFRVWNSPESYSLPSWVTVGDRNWALGEFIAHGEISDVYAGRRARWPTELVLLKLLRDCDDVALLINEWTSLQTLQQSDAPGADTFTMLLPQPVIHGDAAAGPFAGRRVSVFRWVSGFRYTVDQVLRVYPQGIPPRASIWVWRRILEVLSFIHASGMAHGAVVPAHLLVQENEHGMRLVGYGRAGRLGQKSPSPPHEWESFYPQPAQSWSTLTTQLDLVMSARCIVALLGGNPATATLPATVPGPLAEIVRRFALSGPAAESARAWDLREELGQIATQVFGPPQFCPIVMPA